MLYKEKESIEISVKSEQEKKQELIGTVKPHKNHKLYEYNTDTHTIALAEFRKVDPILTGFKTLKINKEVNVKKHCLYITALNFTNAKRKIVKMLGKHVEPISIVK